MPHNTSAVQGPREHAGRNLENPKHVQRHSLLHAQVDEDQRHRADQHHRRHQQHDHAGGQHVHCGACTPFIMSNRKTPHDVPLMVHRD